VSPLRTYGPDKDRDMREVQLFGADVAVFFCSEKGHVRGNFVYLVRKVMLDAVTASGLVGSARIVMFFVW